MTTVKKCSEQVSEFQQQVDKFQEQTKTSAIHRLLFERDFMSTVILFTNKEVHVLASRKKCELLEPLNAHEDAAASSVRLLLHRTNNSDGNC